jgi:hypothetical protein
VSDFRDEMFANLLRWSFLVNRLIPRMAKEKKEPGFISIDSK